MNVIYQTRTIHHVWNDETKAYTTSFEDRTVVMSTDHWRCYQKRIDPIEQSKRDKQLELEAWQTAASRRLVAA